MTETPTYGGMRGSALLRQTTALSPADWVDLGRCETIAATTQPPISRAIVQLQPYRNHLFLGYGEWDAGLDACDLVAWNTETSQFDIVALAIATDALWTMRVIDDALWALVTDPSVGTDPDAVVVARDNVQIVSSGQIAPWHLFDVQSWAGALYLAGANRVDNESRAAVWRSTDGGKMWEIVLDVVENERMHGLFALDDLFYAVGLGGVTWQTGDGIGWTRSLTDLLPVETTCVRPWSFAHQAVYLSGWNAYGPQSLYAFDGRDVRACGPQWTIQDVFSDGRSLVILTVDREVQRTVDLVEWEVVAIDAPMTARSLCLIDEVIYLGTSDSHLWRKIIG